MNNQKGFAYWIIVILISVMAMGLVGAAWWYEENKEKVTTTTNANSATELFTNNSKLMSLSGTLYPTIKYFEPYYIELDGSLNRFYLRGKGLKDVEEGMKIMVKGIIKTYHHSNKPGEMSAMPDQWIIYMDVSEVEIIY